jgi:hypothetical protein
MDRPLISNTEVYKAIADEAYQKMIQLMADGRRPRTDGNPGWIITRDPSQNCFKQSMISIVFTGMWLEAFLHLLIVRECGEEIFKAYDRKTYEEKLQLLGCTDERIFNRVSRFREARISLVHEKALLDGGEIKFAQEEAENAHGIFGVINSFVSEQFI